MRKNNAFAAAVAAKFTARGAVPPPPKPATPPPPAPAPKPAAR